MTAAEPSNAGPERLHSADRQSNLAALVLSLTLAGDVVLYLLLPLHAASFGVSLPEAGALLAANRLVRIVGYGWVARYFQRHGPRRTCTLAAIAAAVSTLGYGMLAGFLALLAMRLLWGLAFAAMNIATQVLATAEPIAAARRSGRSRAIVSVGPMVGLLAGAAASEVIGPQSVFLLLGAIAFLALLFTPKLSRGTPVPLAHRPRFALPSRLDTWSFVQGLTLDGLFVIGLSVLAANAVPQGAALAAGAALALRYLTEMLLSPVGGAAAERWGPVRMLVACSLVCALGLMLVGSGALWVGALTVVVMRGMLQPLPAPVAALTHQGSARVGAIARVATWRDLGAGIGPLAAGALIPVLPAWALYGAAALLLGGVAGAVATGADARRRG
ncbi:MAG: MFS transporter [Burkholderiales bacterium]|nr:MFS transporter [Burkholderiales bacterium]